MASTVAREKRAPIPHLGVSAPLRLRGCIPLANGGGAVIETRPRNPLVVIPAIFKVPLEYIVTSVLLLGVFGIRWLGDFLSSGAKGVVTATTAASKMRIFFFILYLTPSPENYSPQPKVFSTGHEPCRVKEDRE